MTIEDGMCLACDANVKSNVVARKNLSSAVLGGEGLFNLSLQGNGVAALESNVPEDELIEVILENDELKNPAIHLENKRKIHSLVTIKTPV